MEIKIRKAKKEDIPAILRLAKQVVDYHVKIDRYYKSYKEFKNLKEYYQEVIKNKDRRIIVVEKDSKIIGYFKAGIEKSPNYITAKEIGVIYDAFIKKEYRDKGIGQKLFNQILKYFKLRKIKHIELGVDARNDIGVKFWKANDFFEYRIKMRRDL